ncbi:MAG: DUF302 domain-containing protein [Bryobacteraceae bacterium]
MRPLDLKADRWTAAEQATQTYVIPEPFERALRRLRDSLGSEGLSVPAELDLSARMREQLGLSIPPCRVLCVDSPAAVAETLAIDSAGAVFLPLHLVVAGRGPRTLVHLAGATALGSGGLPVGVKGPVRKLLTRLASALQRIGSRQSMGVLACCG